MKGIMVAGALALALAGCGPEQGPVLISKQFVVPDVPSALYNCPIIRNYPEVARLTDRQVAQLIVELQRNNTTCKNSMEAIRSFLVRAKVTVQK